MQWQEIYLGNDGSSFELFQKCIQFQLIQTSWSLEDMQLESLENFNKISHVTITLRDAARSALTEVWDLGARCSGTLKSDFKRLVNIVTVCQLSKDTWNVFSILIVFYSFFAAIGQ